MTTTQGERKRFPVTDDDIDAPEGAIVKGFQRIGNWWEPIERDPVSDPRPGDEVDGRLVVRRDDTQVSYEKNGKRTTIFLTNWIRWARKT